MTACAPDPYKCHKWKLELHSALYPVHELRQQVLWELDMEYMNLSCSAHWQADPSGCQKHMIIHVPLYWYYTILWGDLMLWTCSMHPTFAYTGVPPKPFSRPKVAKDTPQGTVAKKPEKKLLGCNFQSANRVSFWWCHWNISQGLRLLVPAPFVMRSDCWLSLELHHEWWPSLEIAFSYFRGRLPPSGHLEILWLWKLVT